MKQIAIAPNDDGFGTSAWVVGLAYELAQQPEVQVTVIVTERPWSRFHHNKYRQFENIRPVVLPDGVNNIVMAKNYDGSVNIAQTVERCILGYPVSREQYSTTIESAAGETDFDLVIDFGVSQLVAAAQRKNWPTWTIFDHAWSLTLAQIGGDEHLPAEAAACLDLMRQDEAAADRVTLFDEPVAPLVYHDYWAELYHLEAIQPPIAGGTGGPLRTLDFVKHPEAAALRQYFDAHGTLPDEAYQLARTAARELLALDDDRPTLLISGGGTAVWDELLESLFDSYAERPPNYNIVTYNPTEAARRGMTIETRVTQGRAVQIGRWGERVTFLGAVEAETHHPLFAAFDLILTRAGGGTVDNALSHRVPLLLVEEAGMWQVEQIRQSCLQLGIAEGVSLAQFRADPRGCVETAAGQLKRLVAQQRNIAGIKPHQEVVAAKFILESLRLP